MDEVIKDEQAHKETNNHERISGNNSRFIALKLQLLELFNMNYKINYTEMLKLTSNRIKNMNKSNHQKKLNRKIHIILKLKIQLKL